MTYCEPARTTTRRIPKILVAGLLVVSAVLVPTLGYRLLASLSSTAASPLDGLRSEQRGVALATSSESPDVGAPQDRGPAPPRGPDQRAGRQPGTAGSSGADPRGRLHRGAPGAAGGAGPDGMTAFDDEIPGVANLDPALLQALRQAATEAADDRVEVFVTSGWRSLEDQEQLLHEAVSEYGSEEEAARWVATPATSAHVSGDAVDIGPFDAMAWLSEHGAKYGLCQIYSNEPWHYELRPEAVDHGCPRMYADPTHDPRMQ